jgi:6-phospho-beta-glucosidase
MKLTVIGGGSTYTPELADGLGRLAPGVTELVLVDPDETRLAAVGPVSARIMRAQGHPARVRWTTSLDDGADGAGAVLIQLRVGGQAARDRDETWPLDYGRIGQETTGAGGLAKALRTVPVVLEVAERVRRRAAPGAWIIDFTNPVGIVTRALLDAGHRTVGLCNVAIGFQRWFASLLGVSPGDVSLDHAGLNHLTWTRAVLVDGKDRLPDLLAGHGEEIAGRIGLPLPLLSELGAVPSYYLRYFYAHDAAVGEQRERPTRAAEVAGLERELLRMYADPALDHKPELLSHRGGAFYSEAAVALLSSLLGDGQDVQVVNLRNNGTLPFLDGDAVIEAPARIGRDGPVPEPAAPLAPLLRGLVAHVSAYEELALDAALRGGRNRVAAALLAHPLVGQYTLAEAMTERLLAENARFLSWALGAVLPWLMPYPRCPRCWLSTAGTARPTSRSSPRTARCLPRSAGLAPTRNTTASMAPCEYSARSSRKRPHRLASLPRGWSPGISRAAWPAPTCPRRRSSSRRRCGAGAGRSPRPWPTTRSPCCAPGSPRPQASRPGA